VVASILFVVTEDWYFLSHRLPLARAARNAGYSVSVACNISKYANAIEDEGFTLHPIPVKRRSINPLHEMRSVVALNKLLRSTRPDIVHALALKSILQSGVAASLAGNQSVVYAVTGLGYLYTGKSAFTYLVRSFVSLMLRFVFSRPSSRVIFQNPDDFKTLRSEGVLRGSNGRLSGDGEDTVHAQSVFLIPGSGVDTAEFVPLSKRCSGGENTVVVTLAARMLIIKGVADFVAAARILKRQGILVRCRLVGEYDPENRSSVSRSTLLSWKQEGVVEWCGHRDDMRTVWQETDIAVLASHAGEGVPKSLIEAASSGCPLIATDVPGCREICHDGLSGILVPAQNPNALATAIRRLAVDEAKRRSLGKAGRRLVEQHFSTDTVAAKTLAVYREMTCSKDQS